MLTLQLAKELQPNTYLLEALSYLIATKQLNEAYLIKIQKLLQYWKKIVTDENIIKLMLNLDALIKARNNTETNLDSYVLLSNKIEFYYKLYNASNDITLKNNIEKIVENYTKIYELNIVFEKINTKNITKDNIDVEFKNLVNDLLDIYSEEFNPFKKNVMQLDATKEDIIFENIENTIRIPSFIPELDYMMNGFIPNTFYLFAGALGGGKSALLLNLTIGLSIAAQVFGKTILKLSAQQIKQKVNIDAENYNPIILYISLENTNLQIMSRYFSIIKDLLPFQSNIEQIEETRLSNLLKLKPSPIRSYEFADDFLYPLDVKNIIDNEIAQGNYPIAIIIDYLDEFNVTENMELRHKLGLITKVLRMLALRYNTVIISATQLNRRGIEGKLELSSLSESIEHAKRTDFLAFLNTFNAPLSLIKMNEMQRNDEKFSDQYIFMNSGNDPIYPAMHIKILKNRIGLKLGKVNIITSKKSKLGFDSLINAKYWQYSIAHGTSTNILESIQLFDKYSKTTEYFQSLGLPFSYDIDSNNQVYDIVKEILSDNDNTNIIQESTPILEQLKEKDREIIESATDLEFNL